MHLFIVIDSFWNDKTVIVVMKVVGNVLSMANCFNIMRYMHFPARVEIENTLYKVNDCMYNKIYESMHRTKLNGLFLYGRVSERKKTIRGLVCFSHFIHGHFFIIRNDSTKRSVITLI